MGNGLDKPETSKDVDSCLGNGMVCGVVSMQGWRPEMEVSHKKRPPLAFAVAVTRRYRQEFPTAVMLK